MVLRARDDYPVGIVIKGNFPKVSNISQNIEMDKADLVVGLSQARSDIESIRGEGTLGRACEAITEGIAGCCEI